MTSRAPRLTARGRFLRFDERLFLTTAVRAAGHPHRAAGRVVSTQGAPPLGDVGGHGEIELQIARHMSVAGIGAQCAEAVRISLALRGDDHTLRESLAEKSAQASIAADRAGGQARAGQHERHPPAATLVIEIRPQLGLENHRDSRLDPLEEAPHGARQIEGKVADLRAVFEEGARARRRP